MSPLCPLLLLSLPLLLAACNKKPAELAPRDDKSGSLLGTWQLEYQDVTLYNEQGQVVSRRSEPRRPSGAGIQSVAFTDSIVQLEQHGLRITTRYTRHGDTLRVPGTYTWVIQRLTAQELVYQEDKRFYLAPPPAPFKRQETFYYITR